VKIETITNLRKKFVRRLRGLTEKVLLERVL
jgi:hypothetical protein